MTQGCVLQAQGITCYRDENVLFSDVSFTLDAGQALQIEGVNGAGKTTLLRILCGLGLADEGEVLWQDKPVRQCRDEFNANLVYIGHQEGLKGDLTPIENLRMDRALHCSNAQMTESEAIAKLGLLDRDEVLCRHLSAGQRRRVALARLLLLQARLWVLDEPLTALDVKGRKTIEDLIAEHVNQGGMAVFTTHHPLALAGCDIQTVNLSQ